LRLGDVLEMLKAVQEPLDLALDLTGGLSLFARGLGDVDHTRALLALGRLIGSALIQAKSPLETLVQGAVEERR
jgi:hypothetical protein